ncbi:MAG TPA: WYL domain-containing protein [Acidobacteriota bacterium]
MRNQQLIRQWKILSILSSHSGLTFRQIIEALEPDDSVSLRTLQRDLQALEFSGFALESDRQGREVVWTLHLRHGLPFPIELPELIALCGASCAARTQGFPQSARLTSLWQKLRFQLPAKTRAFFEAAEQAIVFLGPGLVETEPRSRLTTEITRWIVESKTAEILYDSLNSGTRGWRRVDPYAIITASSNSYLWGYCHRSREFRTFNVDRIGQYRDSGELFYKLDVSPRETFQHSFEVWSGSPEYIRIRFTGRPAVLVSEKRWHHSQRITKTDGAVEVEFYVHPGLDLQHWILGFGSDSEVIEPVALRERLAAEIWRASEKYKTSEVVKKPAQSVKNHQAHGVPSHAQGRAGTRKVKNTQKSLT